MSDQMNSTTQKSAKIEAKLREAWQQERRFCNLRGAARLLIWAIALIALDFVIDWGVLARTNTDVGYLLPVMNIAVLAWVLWQEWLRHLRPFDPLRVALEVESRHPELESLLVSYTQLEATIEKQPNVSHELIEAMRVQAIDRARPLDFKEIVNFGQLRKLLYVTVGTIVLFTAISINWQGHVSTLLQRLAGAEVGYPKQTTIVDMSGDLVVRIGDDASIRVKVSGVFPDDAQVFTRLAYSDTEWKSLPLTASPNELVFTRDLKGLTTDLAYFVRAGDDQSAEHKISVIHSPRVVTAKLTLSYPEYMGRDATETDQLNVEVPAGTQIRWRLNCSTAIKRLQVKSGETSLDAELDDAGRVATFTMRADQAFKYSFRWTERGSGQDFEYDDVQQSVRVVADALPEVELLSPAAGGVATVKKIVNMRVRAKDDHGLSSAWLVYSVNGSEEKREVIHDFAGAASWDFQYSWNVRESIPELQPNMRVIFAVEVGDKHPTGDAHLRRSASRQLSIVEPDVYLRWYRGELAAQNDEIRRALEVEKQSSARVKVLKAQEGESP